MLMVRGKGAAAVSDLTPSKHLSVNVSVKKYILKVCNYEK